MNNFQFRPLLVSVQRIALASLTLTAPLVSAEEHDCQSCLTGPRPLVSEGAKDGVIFLRNRVFSPTAGDFSELNNANSASGYRIVQMEPDKLPQTVAALEETGVKVLQWVPSFAAAVYIPEGVDISNIEGVRWAGSLHASDKISSYLSTADKDQHAVVDLFPGADRVQAAEKLSALGISVDSDANIGADSLLVSGNIAELRSAGSINEISFIFPASEGVVSGETRARCPGPMTTLGSLGFFATRGDGWDGPGLNAVTLYYRFTNGTVDIVDDEEEEIVVNALTTWSKYADITWLRTETRGRDFSFDIEWGPHPDFPFDGPGGTLAYCFYPAPPNAEPDAGNMYFDTAETWTDDFGATDFDLFTVALHEAGHGLGIEHSADPNAVMFPFYGGAVADLAPDDIAAIRSIYLSQGTTNLPVGDAFEYDNVFSRSNTIGNNVPQSHNLHRTNDVDFVDFTLDDSAEVTIETSGSSGDTQLHLYDSEKNQINYDNNGGKSLFSKIITILPAGKYFVKVSEYGENDRISQYELRLNYADSGFDEYEPDGSQGLATTLEPSVTQQHSLRPAGDLDYVKFTLTQESDVVITTSGVIGGDTIIQLFSNTVSNIETNDDGGVGKYSQISRYQSDGDALAAGTYYVLISENGNDEEIINYTVSLSVIPVGAVGDDNYEESDSLATAYVPGFNWVRTDLSSIDGLGNQADDDWFEIDVVNENKNRVLVDLSFLHAFGDIDLQLYTSTGRPLATSDSTTDTEIINRLVPGVGKYYLRVYYGDTGSPYDIYWDAVKASQRKGFKPEINYSYPVTGMKLRNERHRGSATDADGNIRRVKKFWQGGDWLRANYNRRGERFSYRIRRNNDDFQNRRWVRFKVEAIDNTGQKGKDKVLLRRR